MRPSRSALQLVSMAMPCSLAFAAADGRPTERQLLSNASAAVPIVLNTGNLTCGPIFNFPPATLGLQLSPLADGAVVLGRPPTCASTMANATATWVNGTSDDAATTPALEAGSAAVGNASMTAAASVIDPHCEMLGDARWWRIDPELRCGLQFLVQCHDVLPLIHSSRDAVEDGGAAGDNGTSSSSTEKAYGNATCSRASQDGGSKQRKLYCCPDTLGVLTKDGTAVDHYSCGDPANVQYFSYFCYRDL